MQDKIKEQIKIALKNIGIQAENIVLEHPADFKNGDYSTNVAMVYAKQLKISPKELAEKIVSVLLPLLTKEGIEGRFLIQEPLSNSLLIKERGQISKIDIAGFGFINFYLSREFFSQSIKEILNKGDDWGKNEILKNKKVMVEYTQPNPFKPFHIGHLMSNAIGESISRIVEFSGAETVRANYQGDIGLHVAKAIYGLQKFGMPDKNLSVSKQAQYIGEQYSKGSDMYENDEKAKGEINTINKKVYNKSDEEINKIYDWGRKITLDAFEEIYKILCTKFQHYFFESEMAVIGEKIVRENTSKAEGPEHSRGIFTESEGAIVFKGEDYDDKLHTRVFITSLGLPLYETKEIGLTMTKFEKEKDLDLSIVTTAIEQGEYMKVVQKAISLMHPELEKKMKHITHGMMRLASGKMSSRKGNVVTGESLLHDSISIVLEKMKDREITEEEKNEISKIVGVSALKYSILRSSLGSDIIYDFEKSISFEGDSGPYLQYTAVRANAILKKAEELGFAPSPYQGEGRGEVLPLERMLYQFPEIVVRSYEQLEPHHIATYLTELASVFNSFYANTHILNDENQYKDYHIALVQSFYTTMKNGLYLLGIQTPERM